MNIQALQQDTLLKGGAYRIEKILNETDTEITYLSDKYGSDKNVAITEFFMRDFCGREGNKVTYKQDNSDEVVSAKNKFKQEAQNQCSHIIEFFEENDTIYFVKEYNGDGALDIVIDEPASGVKNESKKHSFISKLKWPLISIAVLGIGAVIYFASSDSTSTSDNTVKVETVEKKTEQQEKKVVEVEKESAAFASLMEKMKKVKKDAESIPGVSQHKVLTEMSNLKDEFEKTKSKLSADEQDKFHKAFQEIIEIVKKKS